MNKTSLYPGFGYKILLLIGDALLLYLALWLSLSLRYPHEMSWMLFLKHIRPFTVVYALWLAIFYANNLYNLTRLRDQLNIYFDVVRALLIGGIIAVIVFYLLPYSDLTPKRLLLMDAAIFGALAIAWRTLFFRLLGKYLPINNVAIIGITIRSLELARQLLAQPHKGYHLSALVPDSPQRNPVPEDISSKVKIIENPYDLLRHLKENSINTIITASADLNQSLLSKFFEYLPLQIRFCSLPDFYEEFTAKVPVAALGHAWFLDNINETDKRSFDLVKRFLDIIISGTLLIALFPLIVLAGLLVAITSPGPIIYAQKRMGKKNKIFTAYKIRTMIKDAEKTGAVWAQKNDPRITRVGKILRKTRLDELPQLVNVLRGEMSFIGPRPERPEFVNKLATKIPFYQTRHLVKPGLTGWAQVNFPYGASVKDAMEKLQYDLYYIKRRSLSLDLSIIIRTIVIVLGFKGQ